MGEEIKIAARMAHVSHTQTRAVTVACQPRIGIHEAEMLVNTTNKNAVCICSEKCREVRTCKRRHGSGSHYAAQKNCWHVLSPPPHSITHVTLLKAKMLPI